MTEAPFSYVIFSRSKKGREGEEGRGEGREDRGEEGGGRSDEQGRGGEMRRGEGRIQHQMQRRFRLEG